MFRPTRTILRELILSLAKVTLLYEGWNFNSGNYLFTTDKNTSKYMFQSFTVLQCSHQHCVQPVASDVEVVGYLQQRLLC